MHVYVYGHGTENSGSEVGHTDPHPARFHTMSVVTAFKGPDRRRHRVYVTRNTEYHFKDGFCIAVRDRRTGDFLRGHLALRRRLHGGLKFYLNGAIVPNPGEPQPGEALYFAYEGRDLVTSPLERVDRPEKTLVEQYPPLAV